MTFDRVPTVAVVGRPNVGKSSLFNALVGRRAAIVDDSRGVTRDRLYDMARLHDLSFHLIDTGGIEPDTHDPVLVAMRDQANLALDEADFIIFLTDGQSGVLPADRDIAMFLRRKQIPCAVVVNKIDDAHHDNKIHEFSEMGIDPIIGLSAIHRRGFEALLDTMVATLPPALVEAGRNHNVELVSEAYGDDFAPPDDEGDEDLVTLAEAAQDEAEAEAIEGMLPRGPQLELPDEISVAVVGRPNVGKSSLINSLLGEDRLLVADMPGTTRDAVDTVMEYGAHRYRLIDTAGLRRKRSIGHRLERYSVVASLNAVSRAHVVILVIDGSQPVSDQDQQVASHAARAGKALVVAVNKMDLVRQSDRSRSEVLQNVADGLRFIEFAPRVPIAAKQGKHVFDVILAVEDVVGHYFKRASTSAINRVITDLVRHRPPPVFGNSRTKLLFGAQVAVAPPTFVIVARRPDAIPRAYRKFVERSLREAFDFFGVPLRVAFRTRERQKQRSAKLRKNAARAAAKLQAGPIAAGKKPGPKGPKAKSAAAKTTASKKPSSKPKTAKTAKASKGKASSGSGRARQRSGRYR